jgi:hypothetical protein
MSHHRNPHPYYIHGTARLYQGQIVQKKGIFLSDERLSRPARSHAQAIEGRFLLADTPTIGWIDRAPSLHSKLFLRRVPHKFPHLPTTHDDRMRQSLSATSRHNSGSLHPMPLTFVMRWAHFKQPT